MKYSNIEIDKGQQWRSQSGAHWGTGPTNLVLCPTKLFCSKSLKIATTTLFKEEISYILTYPSHTWFYTNWFSL